MNRRVLLVFAVFIGSRAASASPVACVDGLAGTYPCKNVDLLALVPLSTMGCGSGNDIWGWTDSMTGREYALMGCDNGIAFVDVSDPVNPVYVGKLPTHTDASLWRGVKTMRDHALVVSEAVSPGTSVINYRPGQTRANNAIVALEAGGEVRVYCAQGSGTVELILDVSGYFR
jgi:choice-of-anchor B domain-containing protein